jgi:hypothetical protein
MSGIFAAARVQSSDGHLQPATVTKAGKAL